MLSDATSSACPPIPAIPAAKQFESREASDKTSEICRRLAPSKGPTAVKRLTILKDDIALLNTQLSDPSEATEVRSIRLKQKEQKIDDRKTLRTTIEDDLEALGKRSTNRPTAWQKSDLSDSAKKIEDGFVSRTKMLHKPPNENYEIRKVRQHKAISAFSASFKSTCDEIHHSAPAAEREFKRELLTTAQSIDKQLQGLNHEAADFDTALTNLADIAETFLNKAAVKASEIIARSNVYRDTTKQLNELQQSINRPLAQLNSYINNNVPLTQEQQTRAVQLINRMNQTNQRINAMRVAAPPTAPDQALKNEVDSFRPAVQNLIRAIQRTLIGSNPNPFNAVITQTRFNWAAGLDGLTKKCCDGKGRFNDFLREVQQEIRDASKIQYTRNSEEIVKELFGFQPPEKTMRVVQIGKIDKYTAHVSMNPKGLELQTEFDLRDLSLPQGLFRLGDSDPFSEKPHLTHEIYGKDNSNNPKCYLTKAWKDHGEYKYEFGKGITGGEYTPEMRNRFEHYLARVRSRLDTWIQNIETSEDPLSTPPPQP